MSHIFVRSELIIDARPADVFNTLADYQAKRPRILPPNYLDYTVEKGGQGGGTVISYRFRAAGRERSYEMHVEETVKGQVLIERDAGSSLVTRWSVLPVDGGQKSRVSVESDWEGAQGIGGFFERSFAPMGLRKVYGNMLIALAMTVQSPGQNQEMLRTNEKKREHRASMLAIVIGSALAFGAGISYLRKQRSA